MDYEEVEAAVHGLAVDILREAIETIDEMFKTADGRQPREKGGVR